MSFVCVHYSTIVQYRASSIWIRRSLATPSYIHTDLKAVAITIFSDHVNDKGQGHKYCVNRSLDTRLNTTNTFLSGKLQ